MTVHSKGDFIDIELSNGKTNSKLKAKVLEVVYSKKKNATHYRLEDKNGNIYLKSIC